MANPLQPRAPGPAPAAGPQAVGRPGVIPLPLLGPPPRPPTARTSSRGRWRAAVLIMVHLVVAAHLTHAAMAGRTLSPVEPSEAMYTLELGWVNAG
ncbi:MAG: hypothetical protein JO112_17215, partial [Planctomycetes bacterium]|nr:hypothetical protein [Planctomycetota bacterium]